MSRFRFIHILFYRRIILKSIRLLYKMRFEPKSSFLLPFLSNEKYVWTVPSTWCWPVEARRIPSTATSAKIIPLTLVSVLVRTRTSNINQHATQMFTPTS